MEFKSELYNCISPRPIKISRFFLRYIPWVRSFKILLIFGVFISHLKAIVYNNKFLLIFQNIYTLFFFFFSHIKNETYYYKIKIQKNQSNLDLFLILYRKPNIIFRLFDAQETSVETLLT
jgi:hypothetical protein